MLCPVIPLWDGIEPTTREREAGTKVGYNCSVDKVFQNGDVFKQTTCNDTGSWTPHIAPCTGKTRESPLQVDIALYGYLIYDLHI